MTGETVQLLAVVTGAARGIGADVARQLCESGYSVIVAARDLSAVEAHVEMLRAGGFDAFAERLDAVDALEVPADLKHELRRYRSATTNFAAFPPSTRKAILEWITQAKTNATRTRRIEETAALADQNIRANQWRHP